MAIVTVSADVLVRNGVRTNSAVVTTHMDPLFNSMHTMSDGFQLRVQAVQDVSALCKLGNRTFHGYRHHPRRISGDGFG